MGQSNKEPVVFHWTRVRSKGDSTFYDPQADIRKIMPTVVNMTLDVLMERLSNEERLAADFKYLSKCYSIYQIRLAEDSTNMVQQVNEFTNAISKASPVARYLWNEAMFTLLNAVYGLFSRRDSKTDGSDIRQMLNTAKIATLASVTDTMTAARISTAYKMRGDLMEEALKIDQNGKAICEETKEFIENINQLARLYINHTGSDEWQDLAEACDKFFDSGEAIKLSDKQQLAIALAYPNYDNPYLTAEVTGAEST